MRYFVQPAAREAEEPMSCLSACSGRGTCVLGGCVCERGYWGSDCSLSWGPDGRPALLAGGPGPAPTPRAVPPRIYIYDLPHKWTSWFHPKKLDRATHWALWERLLSSGVVTADGERADWYFLPLKLRSTGDGPKLLQALGYVRKHWPWFDRLEGHRHFVLHTGDSGRGEVQSAVRAATVNMTWLHHFGLTHDFPYSGWKAGHRPGKDVVVPILFGERQSGAFLPLSPLHPRSPPGQLLQRGLAGDGSSSGAGGSSSSSSSSSGSSAGARGGELLFVGRICGDGSAPVPGKAWPHCATQRSKGYSQGARQWVHYHHHNRTGYKVATSSKTYPLDFMSYRWCLAPSGGGHGHRQTLAAAMGCLPVVVSDRVLQPFEPEMDWAAFSVRVAHEDVPGMHEVLGAVDAAAYSELQAAVRCAAEHLLYSSISGAVAGESGRWDAFETILEVLRMQQTYPGLEPAQYAEADPRFRTFINCGAGSMREYGAAVRQAAAAERGGAAALVEKVYGKEGLAEFSWDVVYNTGLDLLLRAAEAEVVGEDKGKEEEERLCSASKWDPVSKRCGFRKDAGGGAAGGGLAQQIAGVASWGVAAAARGAAVGAGPWAAVQVGPSRVLLLGLEPVLTPGTAASAAPLRCIDLDLSAAGLLQHLPFSRSNTSITRAGLADLSTAAAEAVLDGLPRKRGAAEAVVTGPENVDPQACARAAGKHLAATSERSGAPVAGRPTSLGTGDAGGSAAHSAAAASLRLLSVICCTSSAGGVQLQLLELYLAADGGSSVSPAPAAAPLVQQLAAGALPAADSGAQRPELLRVSVSLHDPAELQQQHRQPLQVGCGSSSPDSSGLAAPQAAAASGGLLLRALLPPGSGRLTACCPVSAAAPGSLSSSSGGSGGGLASSNGGSSSPCSTQAPGATPVLVGCSSGRVQLVLPMVWRTVADAHAAAACGAEHASSSVSLPGAVEALTPLPAMATASRHSAAAVPATGADYYGGRHSAAAPDAAPAAAAAVPIAAPAAAPAAGAGAVFVGAMVQPRQGHVGQGGEAPAGAGGRTLELLRVQVAHQGSHRRPSGDGVSWVLQRLWAVTDALLLLTVPQPSAFCAALVPWCPAAVSMPAATHSSGIGEEARQQVGCVQPPTRQQAVLATVGAVVVLGGSSRRQTKPQAQSGGQPSDWPQQDEEMSEARPDSGEGEYEDAVAAFGSGGGQASLSPPGVNSRAEAAPEFEAFGPVALPMGPAIFLPSMVGPLPPHVLLLLDPPGAGPDGGGGLSRTAGDDIGAQHAWALPVTAACSSGALSGVWRVAAGDCTWQQLRRSGVSGSKAAAMAQDTPYQQARQQEGAPGADRCVGEQQEHARGLEKVLAHMARRWDTGVWRAREWHAALQRMMALTRQAEQHLSSDLAAAASTAASAAACFGGAVVGAGGWRGASTAAALAQPPPASRCPPFEALHTGPATVGTHCGSDQQPQARRETDVHVDVHVQSATQWVEQGNWHAKIVAGIQCRYPHGDPPAAVAAPADPQPLQPPAGSSGGSSSSLGLQLQDLLLVLFRDGDADDGAGTGAAAAAAAGAAGVGAGAGGRALVVVPGVQTSWSASCAAAVSPASPCHSKQQMAQPAVASAAAGGSEVVIEAIAPLAACLGAIAPGQAAGGTPLTSTVMIGDDQRCAAPAALAAGAVARPVLHALGAARAPTS
ncbi:hypothetical protein HXX76_015833 [Chlamydomonas incerta]|uniref:EGF-like domain-containing protein n=1 Tax=Chlamydomonas incerta TaxID=51695 RepID=A0A835SDJ3_CHLIN|nr:hypothetical protein HXX76_015833 [Chlamydomonas incerta]|eukprot:KAG2422747.1 hypothetical protein HXX76_015833 [Chlamydomonas incerta]